MTDVAAPPSPPRRLPPHDALDAVWRTPRGIPAALAVVNHKQVGLRFIWTAVAFLFIGGVEALLVRIQLARPENGVLSPETYNQVFTMHGTTMMFLFAVPMLEGFAMYLTPLQLGTRDLPFPRMNAFGYWCYLFGGLLLNWSLVTGSVPDGGWFAYTPLSGPQFSPSRALDFWLIGITLVEIAGILGAVELIVAILKQRAPGMNLARIPLFCWSVLVMAAMMLVAFPVVLTGSLLLELERKLGAPFYDATAGGNPLLWQHLFWIFGHPEVYIMLIPATGIVSAVVSAHTGRPVVAYRLVVAALVSIGIASFGLWVHHMFTVGLPQLVLALFAMASFAIAVPSGVQIFAWIATIWEGTPRWRTPMWFVLGVLVTFVLGGFSGVMVATPSFDGQAHDSYFVVAHFHYVLIGGVVFPLFAGLHHWFPKFFGRLPDERVGRLAFFVQFIGFHTTFLPQHVLGLQGMARRVYTYPEDAGWGTGNLVSSVGSFVFAGGVLLFIGNLVWARRRGLFSDGDPWRADTLEWSTSSPPDSYNFAQQPLVTSRSPRWTKASKALDAETSQALLALEWPYRARREVVQTSVFDARPEAVFALPGPSLYPLATASALSVALIGVLVDWWALAIGGAAALLWSLAGWLHSNGALHEERGATPPSSEDEAVLEAARALADRRFSVLAGGRRRGFSMVIAGTLAALGAVVVIVAALLYSYGYLWTSSESWPPAGVAAPRLGWGDLIAGVAAAALLSSRWWWGRGERGRARIDAAAGVLFIGSQTMALDRRELAITGSAYEAIATTLGWTALLLAAAALAVTLGTLRQLRVEAITAGRRKELATVSTIWWCSAAAVWLACSTAVLAPIQGVAG